MHKFFAGDERQIVLGNLIDMPSKSDIDTYYKGKFKTEKIDELEDVSMKIVKQLIQIVNII